MLPAMAEHILATCPTAEASWYEGVGHTLFLEDPERFNRELAALARRLVLELRPSRSSWSTAPASAPVEVAGGGRRSLR